MEVIIILSNLGRGEYSHPLYVKRMAAFTEEFDEDNRMKDPDKIEIKAEPNNIPQAAPAASSNASPEYAKNP